MFGVWKKLFPCLSMSIRTKRSTTLSIIVATAVLYTFRTRSRHDPIEEENLEDHNKNPLPDMNDQNALGNATRRALIIQYFYHYLLLAIKFNATLIMFYVCKIV